MLSINHINYAYNSLKELISNRSKYLDPHYAFSSGKIVGFLEACLQQFDSLETETEGNTRVIKLLILKPKTWYRKEVRETVTEAIIRMTEKLLKEYENAE